MTLLWLGLWAAVAGIDLVSVLQTLLSRPLVVGAGAGVILGDADAGLRVGLLLELFVLDVVPVGAVRYPDFGAPTAAAVLLVAGTDWTVTLGIAGAFALLGGMAAGTTVPLTRRANARVLARLADQLAAGDVSAVRAAQWRGLFHDGIRSTVVAAAAVGLAWAARGLPGVLPAELGQALTAVAVAGGVWAAVHGAVVNGRSGHRWRWLVGGLALGLLGAAWQ